MNTETIQVLSPHQLLEIQNYFYRQYIQQISVQKIGIHSSGELRVEFKDLQTAQIKVEMITREPKQMFENKTQ